MKKKLIIIILLCLIGMSDAFAQGTIRAQVVRNYIDILNEMFENREYATACDKLGPIMLNPKKLDDGRTISCRINDFISDSIIKEKNYQGLNDVRTETYIMYLWQKSVSNLHIEIMSMAEIGDYIIVKLNFTGLYNRTIMERFFFIDDYIVSISQDRQYDKLLQMEGDDGREADKDAYAVFKDNTLTLYYGKNKPSDAIHLRKNSGDGWGMVRKRIHKVVFDPSFKDYRPRSCEWWFYECTNLTSIEGMRENLNTSEVMNMSDMFRECTRLTSLDVGGFNTSNVMTMARMFADCESLASLDVSNFNTAKVMSTFGMFYGCASLSSLNVSGFKTDSITDMEFMFWGCKQLEHLDVSRFNTANVTSMRAMFHECKSLTNLDVSGFKTDNVTNMGFMFLGCESLTSLDVSGFNTEKVTMMNGMFCDCKSLINLDIRGFNTAQVISMRQIFRGCESLTSLDVSGFDTDNVCTMMDMFCDCKSLTNLDVSGFKTDKVTDMQFMFCSCENLDNLDVSGFRTGNVANMRNMFSACKKITVLDMRGFDTAKDTTMSQMFTFCEKLATVYVGDGWNTSNVTNSKEMFGGCYSLTGGEGTRYDPSFKDKTRARIDGGTSNPGYFTRKQD